MRLTTLRSFRHSGILAAQLAILVACQSTTRVKMVEIDRSLPKDSETKNSIQIPNEQVSTPVENIDVIEKSDNLWDRLTMTTQLLITSWLHIYTINLILIKLQKGRNRFSFGLSARLSEGSCQWSSL